MTLAGAQAAGSRSSTALPRHLSATTWSEPLPQPRHFPFGGAAAPLCRAGRGHGRAARGECPGPRGARQRPVVLQRRLQVSPAPCALRPPRHAPRPRRGCPGGHSASGWGSRRSQTGALPAPPERRRPRGPEERGGSTATRGRPSAHLALPSPIRASCRCRYAAVFSASPRSLFPHIPK